MWIQKVYLLVSAPAQMPVAVGTSKPGPGGEGMGHSPQERCTPSWNNLHRTFNII